MPNAMELIRDGILENFPQMKDSLIIAELKLADVNGWDSMSAVNFQMFLEEQLDAEISYEMLSGDKTVGELEATLKTLSPS